MCIPQDVFTRNSIRSKYSYQRQQSRMISLSKWCELKKGVDLRHCLVVSEDEFLPNKPGVGGVVTSNGKLSLETLPAAS